MVHYIKKYENYIIIRRHFILLLFKIAKFIFLLITSFFLYWLQFKYWAIISADITSINYIVFGLCFMLLNYAFIWFIVYIIEYLNKLIIITNEEIIIIRSTLLLKDDIEVLDLYRVMSIDSFSHWLFANIFDYWVVIIEQQQAENIENIKRLYFIPNPQKFISLIKEKKIKIVAERKNRYIINKDDSIKEI
jgi:hypothetical protein